jgi:formiminotetrahydrofolate cyclodeaminase
MEAFKLPKETEEEKEERRQEIQSAMKGASRTPLETMKLGLTVLEIAEEVARKGNPNAITDAGVAGLTALSAVKGARYNVLINLNSIDDEEFTSEVEAEVDQVLTKAEELAQQVETIVEEELA